MKSNSIVQLLQSPLQLLLLGLFVLFSQLVLGFIIIWCSSLGDETHGAQALLAPESIVAMKGQEVYFQEGCHYCHTQNLRPFRWEFKRFSNVEKLGYFSKPEAMEYYYESPFTSGSRRLGPDLARIATFYDGDADKLRLLLKGTDKDNEKGNSLGSLLHSYGYLFGQDAEKSEQEKERSAWHLSWKIRAMLQARVPFSDVYQRSVYNAGNVSRGEALIAYLLSRGSKHIQFKGKYYRKD